MRTFVLEQVVDFEGDSEMSWSKKAAVAYHFIEAADDEYFVKFKNSMDVILEGGEPSGSFDSGDNHFIWKINSKEDITDTETYFISLVKERSAWPVWFNEKGDISSVPVNEGGLGELFYAFINPARKFMLTMAAASGASTGSFKKFLNEFSTDGGVKINPLFENNIDSITLAWDYYKKFSASLQFPAYDDLAEFKTTKEGGLLDIIDELGGLKADITVTAPRQKQVLNADQIRNLVKNLIVNDFCSKLVLRGADFQTESLEEYDLKNAQIKYTEFIDIAESYMSEDEGRGILKRAFSDRTKELLQIP